MRWGRANLSTNYNEGANTMDTMKVLGNDTILCLSCGDEEEGAILNTEERSDLIGEKCAQCGEEAEGETLEEVIQEGERRFPHIVGLYQWGMNYDHAVSPFTLFLDLVGYSDEQIGVRLYDYTRGILGYLEADYLGDTLKEWADKGESAYDFLIRLLAVEGRE
jgi:hypothetical protein